MIPLSESVRSQVGKKILMGITGLALVLFIIIHLIGNLTMLKPGGALFNAYAHKLESFGPIIIAAEIGLAIVILGHFLMGLMLTGNYHQARGGRYRMYKTKGGPSRSTALSRNMIISGAVLFIFIVIHVWQFRFGPSEAQGYVTQVHGETALDLYRVVVETFKQPLWVVVYVGSMLFLAGHLRHGFWSGFQSLGAMNPRFSTPIYMLGLAFAAVMGFGFILLPLYIYFNA